MTSLMLQRQNVNLQSSLASARQRLESAETELEFKTKSLDARDNALSTYERQWLQLEEQLSLLLAGCAGFDALGSEGCVVQESVIQLGTAIDPLLDGTPVDDAVAARCARMQNLTKHLVAAASGSTLGGSDGAVDLVARLEAERTPLSAEAARLRHEVQRLDARAAAAEARLGDEMRRAEQATRELHRERLRVAESRVVGGISSGVAAPLTKLPQALTASNASAEGGRGTITSGGGDGASEEQSALRQELEAAKALGDQRLGELQKAHVESNRLRAEVAELVARPPSDDKLTRHPVFRSLQQRAAELASRCEVTEEKLRNKNHDTALINTQRHKETERFEDYRMQQAQQAAEEAQRHARALATAQAERRSVEMQLAQLRATQQRECEHAKELESQLHRKAELSTRAVDECQRLKAAAKAREAEVDKARSAAEVAEAKAKALALDKDALLQASRGAPVAAEPVEQRWQEALLKIGTLEQRVISLKTDLEAKGQAEDALVAECDTLSQEYEAEQGRVAELRSTLNQKEEALQRAKSDKLRADSHAKMLQAEHGKMAEKLATLSQQAESVSTLRASFEAQLRKAAAVASKRDSECVKYDELIAKHKTTLGQAQQQVSVQGLIAASPCLAQASCLSHLAPWRPVCGRCFAQVQQALHELKATKDAEQRATKRATEASERAAAEAAASKRLAAEKEGLQRKLARAGGGGSDGGSRAGGGDAEIIDHLRKKVKCSLCMHTDKDAIISKCFHAFCNECLVRRLDNRDRKCPACQGKFDRGDIKALWLTH